MSSAQLGRAYHRERAIAIRMKLKEYPYACSDCGGARVHSVGIVAQHHRENRRDPHLTQSLLVSFDICVVVIIVKFSIKLPWSS